MEIKINFLCLDDCLIENVIENFCESIGDFSYEKTDYYIAYVFKLNEINVSFYFRNKYQYFQESNLDFFNKTNGIIVILNDFKNLNNVWKTEIIKNNLEATIPILLLEINKNKKVNEVPKDFYDLFKYISYSKGKNNEKEILNKILENFIRKCSRLINK